MEPLEPLTSLRHVWEILLQTRVLYKAACRPGTAGGAGRSRGAAARGSGGLDGADAGGLASGSGVAQGAYDEEGAVGDLEGEGGDDALLAVGLLHELNPPHLALASARFHSTPCAYKVKSWFQ